MGLPLKLRKKFRAYASLVSVELHMCWFVTLQKHMTKMTVHVTFGTAAFAVQVLSAMQVDNMVSKEIQRLVCK